MEWYVWVIIAVTVVVLALIIAACLTSDDMSGGSYHDDMRRIKERIRLLEDSLYTDTKQHIVHIGRHSSPTLKGKVSMIEKHLGITVKVQPAHDEELIIVKNKKEK